MHENLYTRASNRKTNFVIQISNEDLEYFGTDATQEESNSAIIVQGDEEYYWYMLPISFSPRYLGWIGKQLCHAIQLRIAKIGLPIYGKTNIVKSNVVVCETICMKAQNYNRHFLYNVTQTIPHFFMIQWMVELFGTYNEIT